MLSQSAATISSNVSTSSTQFCLRCSAHLSDVLELGTYAVHCEQQSPGLCVMFYMKQQLMSWALQHIASSFLLQWTYACAYGQVRPTPCDGMTSMAVSTWK